jgi:hypothetical protein
MSLLSPLEGLPEVRWAVEAQAEGTLVGPPSANGERSAPLFAGLLSSLASCGQVLRLGELRQGLLKRPGQTLLAAVRNGGFLLAEVDGPRGTSRVEKALEAWRTGAPRSPPQPQPQPAVRVASGDAYPTPVPHAPVPEAAFSGRLSEFSVPDLLEFLRGAQRSGVLVVSTEARAGVLRFRDGWIIGASAVVTPARRDAGVALLPAAQLDELVRGCSPSTLPALQAQTMASLRELVSWGEGDFSFTREPHLGQALAALAIIDGRQALFEVFQELDVAVGAALSTTMN